MKNNKLVLFVGLFTLLSQTQVQAKEICGEDNKLTCKQFAGVAAMGGAGTAAIGSMGDSVLAEMKLKKAEAFEKEHTKPILDVTTPQSLDQMRIENLAKEIGEGDRIEISYRLSDAANREHHFKQLRSKITAAEDANQHLMDKVFELSQKGDKEAALKLMEEYDQKMLQLRLNTNLEIADIESGRKQAPSYTFKEIIRQNDGNSQAFREFLKRNTEAGGTVTKITRFEATKVAEWAKMAGKAVDQSKITGAKVAKRMTLGAVGAAAAAVVVESAASYTKARLTEKSKGAR